jgi:hypothetical protein
MRDWNRRGLMASAAYVIQAGTLSFSAANAQQNLPSVSSGPARLLVRANNAGVFIGGDGMDASLPAFGFELEQDREYQFDLTPVVGTSQETGIYVAVAVAGAVTVSYVLTAAR